LIWKQMAELRGSDTVARDVFGSSAAISGTTAVVGAPGHANFAGRAYVYTKAATGWKQTAELKGSNTAGGDNFGTSVAISGTTIVVGAYSHANTAGAAYVFAKTGAGWKQTAELEGTDTASDYFGVSAAISGTTAVVGAFADASSDGAAYVFTKTGAVWKQAELKGSYTADAGDFGGSVAISGTTAIVGAPNTNSGAAYVFTKTGAGWKQTAELEGTDTASGDGFGGSVAISGTTAVVGAYDHDDGAGAAYVFTKTGAGWKQVAELVLHLPVIPGFHLSAAGDHFGNSVAVSGTTIVVGAVGYSETAGTAYVFAKTGAGWKQVAELKGADTVANDAFGNSVAISGMTAVVGACYHEGNAGTVYVFEA
jgi:hypothetical protein